MHKLLGSFTGVMVVLAASSAFAQQAPAAAPTNPAQPVAPTAAPPAEPDVAPPPASTPAEPPAAPLMAPLPPPPLAAPPAPPPPPVPPAPTDGPQPVVSKWSTTFYGFTEFAVINDSTQSFNESAGNTAILRPTAAGNAPSDYANKHSRTTFSVRNSRFGFKVAAPAVDGVKASGVLEIDFFGVLPSTTEQATFTTPALRMRQAVLKLETPIVDALLGQTWQLFGWQGAFHPNSVQIQGLPGEVFGRVVQARISKTIKAGDAAIDLAVAAVRPAQRNSGVPDGQAGLRFTYNGWKGVRTAGSTGTAADGLSLGVSGLMRRFKVNEWAAKPVARHGKGGWGVSIDAFLPVIPGALDKRANSLTLTGSFATGTGIADQYSSLTGGIGYPALPAGADGTVPAYNPDIDAGLVTYDAQGNLHTIDWQSFIVGAQYYLPPSGKVWISGNFSAMKSGNIKDYAANVANVYDKSYFWDANLFVDATSAVRFGLEYAYFHQTYGDDKEVHNHRVEFGSWYLF